MSNTLKEIQLEGESLIYKAYELGYETGRKTYEKGLEDAWECARKIVSAHGLKFEQLEEIFGKRNFLYLLDDYSPSEAIDKIREYEEKSQKNIEDFKVGDEIIRNNDNYNRFVIISINDKDVYTINQNGGHGYMKIDILYENYQKTGRSFPQIAEVVKQLKEDI